MAPVSNNSIHMNVRLIKFLLCSLCLHLLIFSALWHTQPFETRLEPDPRQSRQTLSVRLMFGPGTPTQRSTRNSSTQPESIAHISGSQPRADEIPVDEAASIPEAEKLPEQVEPAEQSYMPPGRLTRRPSPLTEIDLNTDEISATGFSGTAELLVLIDSDGAVSNVITSAETAEAEAFARLVTARFKSARFKPGEINGTPVKSQLRITVISKAASAADMRK